jgi:hypothetical protein
LVYPAVRGSDIKRWSAKPEIYALIVQDPKTRVGYTENLMKKKWQRTFNYLTLFKKELLDRAAYKKYHSDSDSPFYSQYNIADYTFARYKVVWKRMASDLVAAVICQAKTSFGWKTIIPTDTTSLFATENESEAHYLCAIINSTIVRNFVKSYSSAGRGFGAPSVMENVGIPKFKKENKTHKKLSELSKNLHSLKIENKEEKVAELEKNVDKCVCALFRLDAKQETGK